MKKLITLLLGIILLSTIVHAASIQGTVYSFSLEKINNLIVEINTQPVQREIAKNGTYQFNVSLGKYTITAKDKTGKIIASENITITQQGSYNIDLISFADLSEEEELLNDTNFDLNPEISQNNNYSLYFIIILILIILIWLSLRFYNKRKVNPNSEEVNINEINLSDKVLEIIKKEDGRMTQKDLRKKLPYSEAKISLIITELESKGKIEKIKKGRGNVIILKK